jgi:hypothetical protein
MLFRIAGLLLFGTVALATSVAAQTSQPAPAITRTVIATTKLPTVTEFPLYFRAVSVTLLPGEATSPRATASSIRYRDQPWSRPMIRHER